MAKKNETTETTTLAPTAPQGETAIDVTGYEEYAGAGFENQTNEDRTIPFLTILQALSPQVASGDHPEMRAGMFYNTATGEAVDGKAGVSFVPCFTKHVYVEWKPRKAGGGFVAMHAVDADVVAKAKAESQKFGKYATAAGNDLIETFYVYGICIGADGETWVPAAIAFTSTQIKKYRGWNTKAGMIQVKLPNGRRIPAPLFSHRYRLKSVLEKNNEGSWFGFDIGFDSPDGSALGARIPATSELFLAALALKKSVESGVTEANHEATTAAESTGGDDTPF